MKYLLLFFIILILSAQERITDKTHLEWKPVLNAISYKVQIKSKLENKVTEYEEKSRELYLDLKPAKYEYRVGAVNKLGKVKNWSEWEELLVVYTTVPVINSNKEKVELPIKEKEFILEGEYFLEEMNLKVTNSKGEIVQENYTRVSDKEIRFKLNLENTEPDNYSLSLINPLDKKIEIESFILTEKRKESIEKGRESQDSVKEAKDADSQTVDPSKTEKVKKEIELWPPIWRSALFPGWGQNYLEQKRKAMIFGGSTIFLLGLSYFAYTKEKSFEEKSQEYTNLLYVLPGERNLFLPALLIRNESINSLNEADDYNKIQQISLLSLFALYSYNLFDVYKSYKLEKSQQNTGFYLNGGFGKEGRTNLQFGFIYRF
jgi:hypothetical protein